MAARTERIRRKSRRAVNYTDLVPRLVTVDDFLEANERANARGKLLLVKWLPRATHGPLPRRAPSTRCTAESVHHVCHRSCTRSGQTSQTPQTAASASTLTSCT